VPPHVCPAENPDCCPPGDPDPACQQQLPPIRD
jgi:hypothetical protein